MLHKFIIRASGEVMVHKSIQMVYIMVYISKLKKYNLPQTTIGKVKVPRNNFFITHCYFPVVSTEKQNNKEKKKIRQMKEKRKQVIFTKHI
jgi:hypothetical protein